MVDGMFMGAALLKALFEELMVLGGYPEMIHYLTTEHGKDTVKKLAEVIVASEWRVPASLMQQLTYKESMACEADDDPEVALGDSLFYWALVLKSFPHIPVLSFQIPGGVDYDYPSLPQEVIGQILNQVATKKPLVVTMDGEEYVLVMASHYNLMPGVVILKEVGEIDVISLAPAKFFDLNR